MKDWLKDVKPPPVDYEEIKIGQDLGSYEYRLTRGRAIKYVEAIGGDSPWYEGDSPFGGPVAPPTACDNDVDYLPGLWPILSRGEGYVANRRGQVHASSEYQFINPAFPGRMIKVTGRIADKYIKESRAYVVIEATSVDETGREIFRSLGTYCWLLEKKDEG